MSHPLSHKDGSVMAHNWSINEAGEFSHRIYTLHYYMSEGENGEITYCVKRGREPNSSPLMKRGNRGRESNFYLMRNGTTFFKRKTFYCCCYTAYWFDFLNQPLFSSLCQLFSIGLAWNHLMSYCYRNSLWPKIITNFWWQHIT